MYEQQMGTGEGQQRTPTGTPSERLIWVALFHLDGYRWIGKGAGLMPNEIHSHVGGNWRTFEDSLRSLVRRGIVERHKDSDVGWLYLLKQEYAQHRFDKLDKAVRMVLGPEGYAKRESDWAATLKRGSSELR